MQPLVLTLDFVDLHQAVARIFDLIRRMGFDLGRCEIEPGTSGFRMNLHLADATNDPARQATLVYRLSQVPALDSVTAEHRPGEDTGEVPRPRPTVSMVLGTELPPA
ncbi:MAG TPA: hypothetical protein VGG27_17695 [Magnetospirillaceae bacterium]|jgi:hypothetical protein